MSFKELKMEPVMLGIALLCGLFGGFGIAKLTEKKSEPVVITGSKEGEKLADVDLVKIPCSSEFISENSDLLCRELFCRMQQRGIDAKTSTVDCAAISNVNNSMKLLEVIGKSCDLTAEDTDAYNKCALRYLDVVTKSKSGQ